MNKATTKRPAALAMLIVYALALFVGTHIPQPDLPQLLSLQDKLLHGLAYLGLTILALRALYRPRPTTGVMIATLVSIALFAAIDEATQAWVPGRFPDIRDWLADMVGVLVGWLGSYFVANTTA